MPGGWRRTCWRPAKPGTIGATPATQNAVIDAVSHLGVRHIDMPATPARVWAAISAAREARASRAR